MVENTVRNDGGWFEQQAAHAGPKLSPTIARAARNWLLWEDAARLAEADRLAGRNDTDHAEAELAAAREAETTDEVTRTYVPWLAGPTGMITAATRAALAAALRTELDL